MSILKSQLLILIVLCLVTSLSYAQAPQISLTLTDVPAGKSGQVVLSVYDGGLFWPVDTLSFNASGTVQLTMPRHRPVGLCAIELPNPAKNKAEFIWSSKEQGQVQLSANYWQLMNGSVEIEKSIENEAYNELMFVKEQYEHLNDSLETVLHGLSVFKPDYKKQQFTLEAKVEYLQGQLNDRLETIQTHFPNTYTTDVLIPLQRVAIRPRTSEFDSYLSYGHEHFMDGLPLNSSAILYHYAFADKVFYYLSHYTDPNTDGARKGIDLLMHAVEGNASVYDFTYQLLLKEFLKIKKGGESIVKYLSDNYERNCQLKLSAQEELRYTAIKQSSIGAKILDIKLNTPAEQPVALRELCTKNKLTILVFWVSWCSRCQKELPILASYLPKYKGLAVYGLNLDEKKEDWEAAIKDKKLQGFVNVSELVPIAKSTYLPQLGVSTTPSLFILNDKSEIIAKNIFGAELEAFIKSYNGK